MTPVRNWIKNRLNSLIPSGTIWSNVNPKAFKALTGVTHEDLMGDWFGTNKDGTIDYKTTGTDKRFTTCTSFLPRFATQVRYAGGLPVKKRVLGKEFDIGLKPFLMFTERGWTPAFL